MTTLSQDRQTDGDSDAHTITGDVTTVVAKGDPWGRVRLLGMLEDRAGSNTFTVISDWEMTAPGSKNVITSGAAGRKFKTKQLGSGLGDTPKITVDAQ